MAKFEQEVAEGDDLCDLCMCSGVNVDRTTWCGKTIVIECGCDARTEGGSCDDPSCETCQQVKEEEEEQRQAWEGEE